MIDSKMFFMIKNLNRQKKLINMDEKSKSKKELTKKWPNTIIKMKKIKFKKTKLLSKKQKKIKKKV